MPSEEIAYNTLALIHAGSYPILRSLREKYSSWQECLRMSPLPEIDPEKEWRKLALAGIRLLLKEDKEYPALLREIPHPPHGLYIKGHLPANSIPVAVIGTRKCTPAGRNTAQKMAEQLAKKGCSIISGLALGIDAAAHLGCVSAEGQTVAVLAHGLDTLYPDTNRQLAKDILTAGGALISEYPLGLPPKARRFLERNRVVSGLSRGVLAIEAPRRSGVLATARFALEQNRNVWVLPGPVDHPNFAGSHALIRSGATLARDISDVLEDLAY